MGFCAAIIASLTANLTGNNWHYLNVAGFFWVMQAFVVRANMLCANESLAPSEATTIAASVATEWKPLKPAWARANFTNKWQ